MPLVEYAPETLVYEIETRKHTDTGETVTREIEQPVSE